MDKLIIFSYMILSALIKKQRTLYLVLKIDHHAKHIREHVTMS